MSDPPDRPRALMPGLSPWDRIQNGSRLGFNQSDCNWFAFEARTLDDARRFAGILALHRTGRRFVGMETGFGDGPIGRLLPIRPRFDGRPLFLAVLYELGTNTRSPEQVERGVEGELDPETFSFVSSDGDWQLIQGTAREWRGALPPELRRFFAADTPAFALRARGTELEIELFLRPAKDPVTYGPEGTPALPGDGITINYVQRTRLELVGSITRRGGDTAIVRGDATQDRHWMTATRLGVRWMWLMARLDDGRECMAYEMRTAAGGRKAPADSGDPIGGGAWIVDGDGSVRACRRWSLVPSEHERTPRGLVPRRFTLVLPDDDMRLTLEHEQRAFVPTRALGELTEAGIWESPARLVDAQGVGGGRFWVDVMAPFGSI